MNAKTCKRLRKIARARTVGKPAMAYAMGNRTRLVNSRGELVSIHDTFIVHPACTRGVYRDLKRQQRKGRP